MVETKAVQEALVKLKESSAGIKFDQRVDMIVTLKDIDLKKPEQQVDFFTSLPNDTGRPTKVFGFVGSELVDEAKKELDSSISDADFQTFAANKAQVKKIAGEYDYFIAQANVMPKVAQFFGRVLGPRNKMPNPKAGCVVPPKVQLGPIKKRLEKTVRVAVRKAPHVQVAVGSQNMAPEQIAENINEVYSQLVAHLPQGINNIKRVYVKFTMSKVERVM